VTTTAVRQYGDILLRHMLHDLVGLGRSDPEDESEPFNMAYLAMRGSGVVNAVSRLHGQVSRRIFQPLFPRWPQQEVPVGHVTNGVHTPTWDSLDADALWTAVCGKNRWRGATDTAETEFRRLGDSELWQLRNLERQCLIEYTRKRLAWQRASQGAPAQEVADGER